MIELQDDERLDYLLGEDLKIIQSPSVFSFSLDAVMLAKFVYLPIQKGNVIDLCTGNGVIPLFLTTRTKAKVTGIEIQDRLYDMAKRSVEFNHVGEQVSLIHGDIKDMPTQLGRHQYDVVTCNPPYFELLPDSEKNPNEHYAIARHEIKCTLDDVVRVSSQLVKQGGKVAYVHRPERLLDIVTFMRKYGIEPKRMQLIYPKKGKEANILLIEGIRDGKKGLKILSPFIMYNEDGTYTNEMDELING